ncbi:hypothetical protein, partial [Parasphingorhabdus sp.]|uniref:hypothetical protein n=1 Tax=Parasphingorhabdus sp. TaxID=2709688 RepID=UPI003594720F
VTSWNMKKARLSASPDLAAIAWQEMLLKSTLFTAIIGRINLQTGKCHVRRSSQIHLRVSQ